MSLQRRTYAHDSAQKLNLLRRNLVKSDELDRLLNSHVGPLRLLNVWGAKFDKTRVDYHLGHVYVIRKLIDIANEPSATTQLYIGINPSTQYLSTDRAYRQNLYIKATERLLRAVIPES